jgi:hypothetical protein
MDPLGGISKALENGRTTLSACAAVQAFLGVTEAELLALQGDDEAGQEVDSIAAAKARIYLAATPPPAVAGEYTPAEWEEELRPYMLLYTAPQGGYQSQRTAMYAYRESGRMYCELEITVKSDYNADDKIEEADRWINNLLGQVIDELRSLAGQAGYLNVHTISVAMGPSRERNEEYPATGPYYWTLLELQWGPEGG